MQYFRQNYNYTEPVFQCITSFIHVYIYSVILRLQCLCLVYVQSIFVRHPVCLKGSVALSSHSTLLSFQSSFTLLEIEISIPLVFMYLRSPEVCAQEFVWLYSRHTFGGR